MTKFNRILSGEEDLAAVVDEAMAQAMKGRPGPVFLGLTHNLPFRSLRVEDSEISRSQPVPRESVGSVDPREVAEAAERLRTASKPLFLVGSGVRWNDAYQELRQLLEAEQWPYLSSIEGRGLVPESVDACLNQIRQHALKESDLLLAVGTQLDWSWRFGSELNPRTPVLIIDREPAFDPYSERQIHPVQTELRAFFRALREALSGNFPAEPQRKQRPWWSSLKLVRSIRKQAQVHQESQDRLPMSPWRFWRVLKDTLPAETTFVIDGGLILGVSWQTRLSDYLVTRFGPGANGSLEVGLPYAIGTKLANPHRSVVAVCGDLAFGLQATELETIVRHRIPILVLVAHNGSNRGLLCQESFFADQTEGIASFVPGVRHERIMEAFGGSGVSAKTPCELANSIARFLATDEPACVDVVLDGHTPYPK